MLLISALLVAQAGPAQADSATEQARQHYANGTKQYDMGHWDEAIVEFEKAYELRPDPSFLYNLAQAHRRKGDLRRALDLYKNFAIKLPKGPQRDEVEEKIAAVQKQIDDAAAKPTMPAGDHGAVVPPPARPSAQANETAVQPAPAPIAPVPQPPAAVAPVAPVPQEVQPAPAPAAAAPPPMILPLAPPPEAFPVGAMPVATASPDAKAPAPGQGLRIAGVICGSVGLASLVGGAVFGWEAKVLSDRVTDAKKFNASDESAGKQAETLQWVFYGVGAGAIVAGGVLYYLGLTADSGPNPGVSITPVLGPNTTGLAATGAF